MRLLIEAIGNKIDKEIYIDNYERGASNCHHYIKRIVAFFKGHLISARDLCLGVNQ